MKLILKVALVTSEQKLNYNV